MDGSIQMKKSGRGKEKFIKILFLIIRSFICLYVCVRTFSCSLAWSVVGMTCLILRFSILTFLLLSLLTFFLAVVWGCSLLYDQIMKRKQKKKKEGEAEEAAAAAAAEILYEKTKINLRLVFLYLYFFSTKYISSVLFSNSILFSFRFLFFFFFSCKITSIKKI